MIETTNFDVTISCKYNNEIKDEKDSVSMSHCPRVGDVISVGGIYKEVISICYDAKNATDVTLFVNVLGNNEEYKEWVMNKLKDGQPEIPCFAPIGSTIS